ncbi:hypothetical protein HPB49_020198 [Dermacentor silvarum]|uniref:Uncharacterized protein n=1 Tax=Dermacentor silvarum TaxID=543639 RepID=A0ACB8C583_DERSI|nr:hypothetical protein HPB49_020198 [Dermacentor silvarum]
MDVQKEYDEVSHIAMPHFMWCAGLPEHVCNSVKCFLTQRTFSIRVAGHATGGFNTKRGVPQGSVLARFLFNLTKLLFEWVLAAISDID